MIDYNKLPPLMQESPQAIITLREQLDELVDDHNIPVVVLALAESLVEDCHVQNEELGMYNPRMEELAKRLAEFAYEFAEGSKSSN